MPSTNILSSSAAFDILSEELDACLDDTQEQIAEAAREAAFDTVDQLSKRGRELTELRGDLKALEKRFGRLVESRLDPAPKAQGMVTPEAKKFRKGLKTPQEEYRVPILRALVDLGGRSELHPVLDRVYELTKDRLNDYDHTVLPSDGATPRWRNTAQWARNTLREEGLIRDDTPRSIWEITEKGREWLTEHQALQSD